MHASVSAKTHYSNMRFGNVLFNLTVFSLDHCGKIQLIDATVWYSPASCSFTMGTAPGKPARMRGVISLPQFFGDLVSMAPTCARTHIHTDKRSVRPEMHLHKQRIHPKSLVKLLVAADVLGLRSPLLVIPHCLSP